MLVATAILTGTAAAQEGADESLRGVLRHNVDGEQVPIEGAEITVADAEGDEIDSATSDEDGAFEIELPGPGSYSATLDTETLPEGVALRDEDRATLNLNVSRGQNRSINFFFGEDTRNRSTTADRAMQLLVEGVKLGLIIAITSVGLSLIYGTTGLVNFAHGELVTFGGLVCWYLNFQGGIPLVWAAPIAIAIGGV
ncbi:MAG: carboxypeptidase regulatory-like domain-containing protein, partial [Acidimicrobiales bacterium]